MSGGPVHHIMTEVDDGERDRLCGPLWFKRNLDHPALVDQDDPWHMLSFATMPSEFGRFHSLSDSDSASYPESRLVRDGSNKIQAVFIPARLRSGYHTGAYTNKTSQFQALALSVVDVLRGSTELQSHFLFSDLQDIFAKPVGGIRYVFGEIGDAPSEFIANGWATGMLVYPNGVLIDQPVAQIGRDSEWWALLLHRLGWRKFPGSPLRAYRAAWGDNVEFEWDSLHKNVWDDLPEGPRKQLESVSKKSFYSVLGTKESPMDIALASVFAIQLLLSDLQSSESTIGKASTSPVDYSQQPWFVKKLPKIKSIDWKELTDEQVSCVGILVATEVEREAVLKLMQPPKSKRAIYQVGKGDNTYYIGRMGIHNAILCMTRMGASGRDSAINVTGEFIADCNPKAVVMVGIAFGKDASKQSIGQVLVSERIIGYENARIGSEQTVPRGEQPQASPVLLNRFSNTIGWEFYQPDGRRCEVQIGPILSGEKLVDNACFKAQLFKSHPSAIGGEMEGIGVASAAGRKRCEWIVVKAICDWGDGSKTKEHQSFAAASAASLLLYVLTQVGTMDGL
jgi:nucleoside phosphorylase